MPRPGPVDLHVHSTASDGTTPPADLARLAADAGLVAFALTDHDTLAGVAAATEAGRRVGVDVVPGVELSVDVDDGELHLLGYFVDPDDAALGARLATLRDARTTRNARIVERLQDLGLDVTLADVLAEAGVPDDAAASVGRPHVAAALLRKGFVASIKDAFDRHLADGRPAFVPKGKLTAEDALRLVRGAGGVAVLAHPFTLPDATRRRVVDELADAGLAGIEVTYPRHDAALREELTRWAAERDLVPTGGSDYHGRHKPAIALGTGLRGNVHVTAATLAALAARRP